MNEDLKELGELEENWDGEGSLPIDKEILAAAERLLEDLNEFTPKAIIPMGVAPGHAGNLQFEWWKGKKSLEIELEDPQTVHYLKWDPDNKFEEEGLFPIKDNAGKILSLIQWFYN